MRRITMTLMLLLLPTWAAAQSVKTELPVIRLCPAEMLPANYPTWTRAGVEPLIPQLRGATKDKVHIFFAENPARPAGMTDAEWGNVEMAREAVQEVLKLFFFPDQKELPTQFRRDLDFATLPENLTEQAFACGEVIYGMSYGTPVTEYKGGPRVIGKVIRDALAIAHYLPGVEKDGKPGVRAWVADVPVGKEVHRLMIFEYCGNISWMLHIPQSSAAETSVVAAMPPPPPMTPPLDLSAAEKPKPLSPGVVSEPPPAPSRSWNPCRGKRGIICGAAVIAAVGFAARGKTVVAGSTTLPPLPTKGGPNGGEDNPGTR